MAKPDLGAIAERLFVHFMAPLVLGGELRPGRPIGGKVALAVGEQRTSIVDNERMSATQLARVRLARKLAPIDVLDAPTPQEWALSCVLHDIVQSSHPDWNGAFRSSAPGRLLDMALLTLERIPPSRTVAEALSRHTWFSRTLDVGRTDTKVSWWVGSQTFLGTEAPKRLQAWPELRRVHIDKTLRPLTELPTSGGRVPVDRFSAALTAFFTRTPLTDLATCARAMPAFGWSRDTLAFVAARAGRTLAVRALADTDANGVDGAMGRAARPILQSRSTHALVVLLGLMGERSLALAQERLAKNEAAVQTAASDDVAFGRAIGAWAAMQLIATHGEAFTEHQRSALLGQLRVLAPDPLVAPVAALAGAAA